MKLAQDLLSQILASVCPRRGLCDWDSKLNDGLLGSNVKVVLLSDRRLSISPLSEKDKERTAATILPSKQLAGLLHSGYLSLIMATMLMIWSYLL